MVVRSHFFSVLSTEYLVLRIAGVTLNESAADITGTTKFKDNTIGVLVNSALNESAELNILGTEEIKFTGNGVGVKSSSLGVNNPSVVNVVGAIFENGAVGNNRGIELEHETRYFIQNNDFFGLQESIKIQSTSTLPSNQYGNTQDLINCNRISSSQLVINVTGNNKISSFLYNTFSDNYQDIELLKTGSEKARISNVQGEDDNAADNSFTSATKAIKAISSQAIAFEYWYDNDNSAVFEPDATGQVYEVEDTDDPSSPDCPDVKNIKGEKLENEPGQLIGTNHFTNNSDLLTEYNSSFTVYPNPFINKLNLISENKDIYYDIKIFDLKGQQLYYHDGLVNIHKMNLDYLESGVYFLNIQYEDGNTLTVRLVKN